MLGERHIARFRRDERALGSLIEVSARQLAQDTDSRKTDARAMSPVGEVQHGRL